ncbi:MAG: SDR family NAD(P)-dependent oxidoreductase [Rhodobacter sp.]|nr:SDR family NAD(P)-dependent oxidoreductase [Rhodobacter sp.]
MTDFDKHKLDGDIAIVGMAVHVPGASTLGKFWGNLRDGVESIRTLDEETLIAAGESPEKIRRSNYVKAAATLDGFDEFDAEFFGFSPKEAAILDPQHRQFLEVAWEALEVAGHPPDSVDGSIGVYAGCGMGSYFYFNLCSNPDLVHETGTFLLRHTGNDKDFLSTRVSHVFDLKGPSINLQTACSTSLVAVHFACRALREGDCKMALAGGATIVLPHGRGYLYNENEILSPDGHCHAFDHRAKGTVFGSGAGAVVLRPLADAIADGDHIWAVIKGSAVNNDGATKASYLAPSVSGQASAMVAAHVEAGITADTIGYVECHGTGTYLGDPIEISALTDAFRQTTDAVGFCRVGSVKSNIGHLDTAAGVASLVKTALSLDKQEIPPSLGYEAPNPVIDFHTSPFFVNDALATWDQGTGPRRAGVNSLGVGGTNAHVILEEAPPASASGPSDWPFHLLTMSGRSKAALQANASALADHLRMHKDQPLADVAFTLKEGRRAFEHRLVLVAETHEEAASLLDSKDPHRVFAHSRIGDGPDVVFMFPGGGAQYPNMGRDLYETEPVFRDWMDRGLDILQSKVDHNVRDIWLPPKEDEADAAEALKRPSIQLPLIMIVEYALAQLWMSWGVRPAALVGHSMGENTAACLAGVMSFEDCIDLVLLRGRLFDTVPAGGMLSVPIAADDLSALLNDTLDIAAVNAPELTVVSGPNTALDAFANKLAEQGIATQRIPIDIAAHSRMLEPILADFRALLAQMDLKAPGIPLVSNLTGKVLTEDQATDPGYWVEHLRHTVRFADCIATLAERSGQVFLEVGPGKTLSSLAQMNPHVTANQAFGTLRHVDHAIADDVQFLGVVGRLWATGVDVDWGQLWGEEKRKRVPLPTYAFQRKRFFIEPGEPRNSEKRAPVARHDDIANWGYRPVWRPRLADYDLEIDQGVRGAEPQTWLIFVDDTGIARPVIDELRAASHRVIEVVAADVYARTSEFCYSLAPELGRDGYDLLVRDLMSREFAPTRIVNFWPVADNTKFRAGSSFFDHCQEIGFYSLMHLGQALAQENAPMPVHITVVTSGAAQVHDEALLYPEKSTISGPAGVMPKELAGMSCATFDIDLPARAADTKRLSWLPEFNRKSEAIDKQRPALTERLLEDLLAPPRSLTGAYRGDKRFELEFRPVALTEPAAVCDAGFRHGGVYMITGGLGGIAFAVANRLAVTYGAKLVLVSRSALPRRSDWQDYLRKHPPTDTTARRLLSLQQLEKAGAEAMIVKADVCNFDEMADAVASAKARFGAIHGVLHAAGTIKDAPFLTKTARDVEEVLAPKIRGLQVLDALFPDGSLDLLVLFSSTSTIMRPAGQIDYVAANEYLNAYAKSRRGGATKVVAVNWGVWSDVGMAAAAVAELSSASASAPVMLTKTPLLDEATFDRQGNHIFSARLSPATNWVLDEHRTAEGHALLPGTGYIELAAETLCELGETGAFRIRDLLFFQPFRVQDGETRDLRVRLSPHENGYIFEALGGYSANGRQGFAVHARALLEPVGSPAETCGNLRIADIESRTQHVTASVPLQLPQQAHMNFGARWRVLRDKRLGDREGLARLSLPPSAAKDLSDGYLTHPALLDLATGWAMELVEGYQPTALWVPVSYQNVRVRKPIPKDIWSWVRVGQRSENTNEFASFDVTICNPNGEICLEIEGFSMKRLGDAPGFAQAPEIDARVLEFDDAGQEPARPMSPAAERQAYNVSQGIRADEGGEALIRAVASDLPQVVASSLDLEGLITQTNEPDIPGVGQNQNFDRPAMDTDYVAPTNETETALAGFWQDLLGVKQVGIHDSFFDLGGHSLIAVRLFAMIKQTFRVEFPISVLFEAPTIAKCAALIAERSEIGGVREARSKDASREFSYLVPMHNSDGVSKQPVFIVAGMFGNVLNLRHLAQLLGVDRPFYGLQARGLFGDADPHRTIAGAAADYIAEIKTVQPSGPYFLGGFSGGGITAFEMAQQLSTAGDEVASLIMLDTPLPVRPNLTRPDKLLIKLHELQRKGIRYLGEWATARYRWELEKRELHDSAVMADDPLHFHDRDIEAAFRAAVAGYELRPWSGPLSLFRPPLDRHWSVSHGQFVSREREYVFPDNQWAQWAPNIKVFEVPGSHDSMVLEPNVRVLAQRIRETHDAAERRNALEEPQMPMQFGATAAE